MIIDGTGFNLDYWSRFSLQQFIEEAVRSNIFNGDIKKITAAYELIRIQGQADGV